MNHVTFETAKKLKAAGFPQTGHAWPQMHYWHRNFSERINVVLTETEANKIEGPHTIAYAPTATELLPERWFLSRSEDEWKCVENPCSYYGKRFYSDNPAEAAAQAWLHVNATKTTKTI